jgi:hypothetical protein
VEAHEAIASGAEVDDRRSLWEGVWREHVELEQPCRQNIETVLIRSIKPDFQTRCILCIVPSNNDESPRQARDKRKENALETL